MLEAMHCLVSNAAFTGQGQDARGRAAGEAAALTKLPLNRLERPQAHHGPWATSSAEAASTP
jgi:hypothetical protein